MKIFISLSPHHKLVSVALTTSMLLTAPCKGGTEAKDLGNLAQSLVQLDNQLLENFVQDAKKQIQTLIKRSDNVKSDIETAKGVTGIEAAKQDLSLGIGSPKFKEFLTTFSGLITRENLQTKRANAQFLSTKITGVGEMGSLFNRVNELVGIGSALGTLTNWGWDKDKLPEGISSKERDTFTNIFKTCATFDQPFVTAAIQGIDDFFKIFDRADVPLAIDRKKAQSSEWKKDIEKIKEEGKSAFIKPTKVSLSDQADLAFYAPFLTIVGKQIGENIEDVAKLVDKKPADCLEAKNIQDVIKKFASRVKQIYKWEAARWTGQTIDVSKLGDRREILKKEIIKVASDKKLMDTTGWDNKDNKAFHAAIPNLKPALKTPADDTLRANVEEYVVLSNLLTLKMKAGFNPEDSSLFNSKNAWAYLTQLDTKLQASLQPIGGTFTVKDLAQLAKSAVAYLNFAYNFITIKSTGFITLDDYIKQFEVAAVPLLGDPEKDKNDPINQNCIVNKVQAIAAPKNSFGSKLKELALGYELAYNTKLSIIDPDDPKKKRKIAVQISLLDNLGGVFFLKTFTALLNELLNQKLFEKEKPI